MAESGEPVVSAAELLAFLADPSSYDPRPSAVRVIQTHASYVAVAPPWVYKVKKPVDFGFLDFSTLAKRKVYCAEEVRLNRRLSSDVYHGVAAIYRTGGGLSFRGCTAPVEFAVRMRQLADGYFLKDLLRRHAVGPLEIDRIARRLAAFYLGQTPRPDIAIWGRTGALRISTDENFEQTRRFAGDLLAPYAFETIRSYTAGFYDHHALVLNTRRVEGKILDCHGDLHLEHLHLTPNELTIFDCVEFNRRLRYIDIANDLAFLAMDLDQEGHRALSSLFVERMVDLLADPDLPQVLDFYKCYRAYVRAKVESFRSLADEIGAPEREAAATRARHYYRLALQYAVAGSDPMVIIVMGRIGTGKTLHAARLGTALDWEVVSSDRLRKESAGLAPTVRPEAELRAQLYAQERTEQVYEAMAARAVQRAVEHGGTILDATYSRRAFRDALRTRLRARSIGYCFVELVSPEYEIRKRLQDRDEADDVVSDARLEDLDALSSRFEAPDALEDVRHFTVNTSRPRDEVTLDMLRRISRLQVSSRLIGTT